MGLNISTSPQPSSEAKNGNHEDNNKSNDKAEIDEATKGDDTTINVDENNDDKATHDNQNNSSNADDNVGSNNNGDKEEKMAPNPFATFSFASAAKANPFASILKASTTATAAATTTTDTDTDTTTQITKDVSSSEDKKETSHEPSSSPTNDTTNGSSSFSTATSTATQPSSIFGSNTSTKPLFGSSTSSRPLFGQLSTSNETNKNDSSSSNDLDSSANKSSTPSTSFGGFGSAFSSTPFSGFSSFATQSNSNTSIFSSTTKASSSLFGNNNISGFGSSATGSTATSSLFQKKTSESNEEGDDDDDDDENNENNANNDDDEISPLSPSLPKCTVPVSNGEENEKCRFNIRAKLYKLVRVVDSQQSNTNGNFSIGASEGIVPSVPPASKIGFDITNTSSTFNNKADENVTTTSENNHNKETSSLPQDEKKMEWKEVGIGPLRILEGESSENHHHVRLVQRRESTPGGSGTKLILNLPLRNECKVTRKSDKCVFLAAFEVIMDAVQNDVIETKDTEDDSNELGTKKISFESVQYLFKVKTVAEADSLEQALNESLEAFK